MRLTRTLLCEYFKRYVDREMNAATRRRHWHPLAGWKEMKARREWRYNEHRPWTDEAKQLNKPGHFHEKIYVEPIDMPDIVLGDRAISCGKHWRRCESTPSMHHCRMFTSASQHRAVRPNMLVGIGNPLLDMTIEADDEFLQRHHLRADDAVLFDATDTHQGALFDDVTTNYSPTYGAGGATLNSIRVAQWMLGGPPGAGVFLGGVGNDNAAHMLCSEVERDGVVAHWHIRDDLPTGTCIAVVTGEGSNRRRSLVARAGAAANLPACWLHRADNWQLIERSRCVYIGGFLFPTCGPNAIENLVSTAASDSRMVTMNLSAPFLCHYFSDQTYDVMPYVDVLFGNETEASEFCQQRGISGDLHQMALYTSQLPKAIQDRKRVVVFTRGALSTVVADGNSVHEYEITPVVKSLVRDTNGCGDAFVGGYLSHLVKGHELRDCIRAGHYAASIIVQYWGCTYPAQSGFK